MSLFMASPGATPRIGTLASSSSHEAHGFQDPRVLTGWNPQEEDAPEIEIQRLIFGENV